MENHMLRNRWLSTLSFVGFMVLLWWILTDGVASSWWIGIPAVLFAVIVSNNLISHRAVVWSVVPRFLLFFILHSLRGGADVAWRVLQRNMPIAPGIYEYTLRLPAGLPQVMMANSVGLLPGTLSVGLEKNVLSVHVLDTRTDFLAELEAVEQHIARMFGKPLIDE